jgi:hypothetical protein
MKETTWYRLAVILFALGSLLTVVMAIPYLLNPETEGLSPRIPQVIILTAALSGVAGLIAAYGAWQRQRWGVWLTVILSAINGLSALPGVTAAPTGAARIGAIATVLLAIFVIVVMLRRPAQAVYLANSTHEALSPSEEG